VVAEAAAATTTTRNRLDRISEFLNVILSRRVALQTRIAVGVIDEHQSDVVALLLLSIKVNVHSEYGDDIRNFTFR